MLPLRSGRTQSSWLPKEGNKGGKRETVTGAGQPVTTLNGPSHVKVNCMPTHNTENSSWTKRQSSKRAAQLIGRKCMLSCWLNGVLTEMLLDTGAQVSMVGKIWAEKFLPNVSIKPIEDLLSDTQFHITAANGTVIPFVGWIEVLLELKSNGNEDLAIHVPMLVSNCCNDNPLLGFNVIEELIRVNSDQPNSTENLTILLSEAMNVRQSIANKIVSVVVQLKDSEEMSDSYMVKVGKKGFTVKRGELCEVKCRIRGWPEGGVMPFEPLPECPVQDGLELFPTVVDVPKGASKVVKIPVLNSTRHDIYLPAKTALGTITLVSEILPLTPGGAGKENNQMESVVHVNQLRQVDNASQLPIDKTVKWHPPVELEHLSEQEQEIVRQMLYDESDVFAHDDGDIGCIPNLKLKINLKDDTPVQKCYNSIPKPP